MTKIIKFFVSLFFIFLLYNGPYLEVSWSENLLKFWIWLIFLMSPLLFIEEVSKDVSENKLIKNKKIVIFVDIFICFFLASMGWFFYATLLLISSFISYITLYEK